MEAASNSSEDRGLVPIPYLPSEATVCAAWVNYAQRANSILSISAQVREAHRLDNAAKRTALSPCPVRQAVHSTETDTNKNTATQLENGAETSPGRFPEAYVSVTVRRSCARDRPGDTMTSSHGTPCTWVRRPRIEEIAACGSHEACLVAKCSIRPRPPYRKPVPRIDTMATRAPPYSNECTFPPAEGHSLARLRHAAAIPQVWTQPNAGATRGISSL
ncbi:hypothetical protein VTO73DRAFT_102 [Trametes versicolor]